MRDSHISLPPLVEGSVRGALRLSLGAPRWAEAAPAHLRQHAGDVVARVEWWGDASGGDLVPLPPPPPAAATSACLSFPLRTGPKYLARYLKDMGALTVTIEAAPGSGSSAAAAGCADEATVLQPLAAATVGLLALDVQAPISGTYPLVLVADAEGAAGRHGAAGRCSAGAAAAVIVGSLEVSLELDFSSSSGAAALVSSFELNEHLAGSAVAAGHAEQDTVDADSDDGGGRSASSASRASSASDGHTAPPAQPAGLCEQLLSALQDRELVASALQQLGCGKGAADEQPAMDGLQLQPWDVACRLLPLLLPAASQAQLDYVAAMLQPFAGCGGEQHACTSPLSLEELAAAAAVCTTMERELASQPAAEALQGLRQAAAALASRSLDLAAAFAAADGQQLTLCQLGALLQQLHPGATADEARRLLTVQAAGGSSASSVTLPALKATLARVQEAQQFPTAEDLARQQAAVEARRAKEAAAAAVAAIEQQRAAAAAAAKVPSSQRKQAVVSKLKSSLQERRRSSTSGSSVQVETQVAPAPAEQPAEAQQTAQLPAVVLGIPVLPPPPPALELLTGLPAQAAATEPAAAAPLPGPPTSAAEAHGAPATAAGGQPLQALVLPEASQQQQQHHHQAEQPQQQQHQAEQPQQPQPDGLLQLIQQAEALKAAMQQAGTGSSDAAVSIPARSQLCATAAAAPRPPNLLLPLAAQAASTAAAAADSSGLSAATAALLAAARALRLESEQLPQPRAMPAAAPSSSAALRSAGMSMLPAAAAAAAPAAVLGSVVVAAGDSDAESDAEDALLDQLFFQRTQQPAEVAGAASPKRLAHSPAPQAAAQQQGEAVQLLLRVQLEPPQLAEPSWRSSSRGGSINSSVRCVVKPLQAGGLPQQLNVPVASAAGAAAVTVELPVMGGVSGSEGRLPLLPPYLFLEFWRHSGDLLGIARVPLLQPPACGPVQRGFPAAVVAEGRHAISDILEGRDAGTIHVAAVLQEQGALPLAAAVRHCFSVAIRSAHRLPSAAAYVGAGLRAPDARLLRYSFPGEPDALQTGEVPCCSSPCFDATATHEMTMPAGRSILPLLQDGLLRFELLDCWADQQQQQQHGWALLQLRELASLAAEAEGSGSATSAARQASRTLLLPLCTEYESAGEAAGAAGAGEAAARGPSLKIELSYQAELCTVDAAEVAAASVEAAPAGRASSSPAKQERAVLEKSAAGAPSGGTSSDSDEENSLLQANRSHITSSGRQAQHAVQGRPAAGAQSAAAARPPTSRSMPAEPFVPATLSVEIIRACGLGAAVREAAAAAGGGAGTSLGRAAVVGPHAFVRLALFPDADAALQAEAPPLQTAFVPQSFCPAWRSVHSYPLQLTGSMVEAVASQSMRVEVWHRCPRAAAGSSSGRDAREVLLGVGAVPLVDVLRKPQGLRCWIPLTPGSSSTGNSASVVGAVQVTACLTSLGSLTSGPAQREPLLLRCTEAAALVPARLRPRLLVPPGAGFRGQPAVLAVHLDTLVPPTGSSLSGGRPKADRFFCRYSLPGADGSSTATASRVLSSVGSSVPAGSQRKGASRGGVAGSGAVEQHRWAAKMNHSGFFEVTADASLVAALLQGPLLVHVYKQPAGVASEAGRSAVLVGTAEVDLSPLLWTNRGDSSGSGAGQAANGQLRSISGTYPLLEGASAAQGGASLAARVELQLKPEGGAAQQAAAAAAAGAHTAALERSQPAMEQQELVPAAAAAAAVTSGGRPLLQPVLQQQEQLLASPSSSDDDEAHEELLQRCQRLTAALRSVCPAETAVAAPVSGHADEGAGTGSSGAAEEQPAAGTSGGQQPAERQAAEGSQAAGSSTGSTLLPQRPQSGAPNQADGGSPSTTAVQQDQPVGPEEAEEAGKLLLQIDCALHLPVEAPGSGSGTRSDSYSAFVAATWGSEQQRTAAVPVHVVAAAELGGTAVWHAELELPAAASQWQSQPHTSGGSGSGRGPNLVLNVWARPGAPGSSGGSGGSGQQSSAADSLLGCCVLDLRALPALQQVAGYWHIVDSQQQRQGQLKASVRANSALRDALQQQRSRLGETCGTAVAGTAAGGAPLQQPQQAPNADAAPVEDQQRQPAAAGDDDLAQQVQAQLEGLELLSQRLAGAPASPAAAATAAATSTAPQPAAAATAAATSTAPQPAGQADRSPALAAPAAVAQQAQPHASLHPAAAGAAGDDATVAALLAAAGPLQADAEMVKPFDALPASDEEWEGSALPLDPRQERLFAWSGSDSDDGMGLVGIAVDGAISGEVTEEEEEQPRAPARLLAEDWMFAISKTAVGPEEERLAAEQAAGQQQQQQRQQAEGQPGQRRAPVRFRNVIPGGAVGGAAGKEPTAPPSHLEELVVQQQREEEEEQATQALLQHSSAAEAAAAAAAARSAAAVEAARAAAAQGPNLHQLDAMPAVAVVQPAPVQLQQPLPRRQQLPSGLQPGWQFDIRREPAVPSAGAAGSLQQPAPWEQHSSATPAATPSSVRLDQFGAQQASPSVAATPASLLEQQRFELQQRSQEARSPAAAATIDEVLAQLRGCGHGAAGAGGTADRNKW